MRSPGHRRRHPNSPRATYRYSWTDSGPNSPEPEHHRAATTGHLLAGPGRGCAGDLGVVAEVDAVSAATTTGASTSATWRREHRRAAGHDPGNDLRIAFITVADQLFVGSLGGELVQCDLDTLAPIRSFGGSGGAIQELDGTSDGSTIAARGGDGNVSLFDVATGNRVGPHFAATPDDQLLMSTGFGRQDPHITADEYHPCRGSRP